MGESNLNKVWGGSCVYQRQWTFFFERRERKKSGRQRVTAGVKLKLEGDRGYGDVGLRTRGRNT